MITKKTLLSVAAAALLAIAGCAGNGKDHKAAAVQLPAPVKAGFDREFPGATVNEAEKETYADGTVHWEVKFTTKDGKKMEQEFDSAGKKLGKH